jgi:lipoate-protein ligase B
VRGTTGDCCFFPIIRRCLRWTQWRGASLGADDATLRQLGIEIFEVARGGDFTWHGPGQLVGYVICDLTSRDATCTASCATSSRR